MTVLTLSLQACEADLLLAANLLILHPGKRPTPHSIADITDLPILDDDVPSFSPYLLTFLDLFLVRLTMGVSSHFLFLHHGLELHVDVLLVVVLKLGVDGLRAHL